MSSCSSRAHRQLARPPRALPTGSPQPSQQACVKSLGAYCHIEAAHRRPDAAYADRALPARVHERDDKISYSLVSTKTDTTCANAVIGAALINALQEPASARRWCAAATSPATTRSWARSASSTCPTTNQAHYAGKVVGQNDFIAPLTSKTGSRQQARQRHRRGRGGVQGPLPDPDLVRVRQRHQPDDQGPGRQLEQFGNDLVAGPANIALSQRMVNGRPPLPPARVVVSKRRTGWIAMLDPSRGLGSSCSLGASARGRAG